MVEPSFHIRFRYATIGHCHLGRHRPLEAFDSLLSNPANVMSHEFGYVRFFLVTRLQVGKVKDETGVIAHVHPTITRRVDTIGVRVFSVDRTWPLLTVRRYCKCVGWNKF